MHAETQFTTHDGLLLYAQSWAPDGPVKANLAVIHGYGEHSGRYADFAAWFTPLGYAVYSFDHRGHGRSPGQRGHINQWGEFREDVRAFLATVQQQGGGRPTFLVGHSMGGLVVLDYGLHYHDGLLGVVSSAPALAQGEGVLPMVVAIANMLASVLPRLQMKSGLDVQGLSRNPDVVNAYVADPLVHGYATPRFAREMQATMQQTLTHAEDWPANLPLLIVHGLADPLCPPHASARFFANAGAADKTRHEYPDYRHEVFNEIGRERVLGDVQTWLEAHLP